MFASNERDLKFNKIVIFSCQYIILEIRQCYAITLMSTNDIP